MGERWLVGVQALAVFFTGELQLDIWLKRLKPGLQRTNDKREERELNSSKVEEMHDAICSD